MQPGHLSALSLIKQRGLGTDAKYTVCPHPRASRREQLQQKHPAGSEMTYELRYLLAVQPSQCYSPRSTLKGKQKTKKLTGTIYGFAKLLCCFPEHKIEQKPAPCVREMCLRMLSILISNRSLGGGAASDSGQ